MSLVDVVLNRRSIRRYEKREVPKDVLDKILEAGRQAPSAGNKQPWHFIVVTSPELKEKLSQGKWNSFVKDSALTIIGCANKGDAYAKKWSFIDTSIALQNMVIAAEAMGVGSCWVGDFKKEEIKEIMGIPVDWRVVALITFGYPEEQPLGRQKKPIQEIVGYNRF